MLKLKYKIAGNCIFLTFFAGASVLNAQNFAKYAGEFLAIGVGARAQAMGSAFAAIADDATASYWNPAGLAQLNYPQLSLMHAEQFAGEINYDFAGVVIPFKQNTSFGFSLIRLGIDGIPDTRNALIDTVQANGRIDEGERLKLDRITYFSNSDYAFYISISQRKNPGMFIGGNIKIIRRGFGDFSAWGIGFDAAMLCRMGENLTIGANLMDATTTLLVWNTGTKELISPLLKTGISYLWRPEFIPVTFRPVFDADIRFESRKFAAQTHFGPVSVDTHYGLETKIRDLLFLRTGIDDLDQISFGVGVNLPNLTVDYSFTSFDDLNELGNTHRISLLLNIEEEKFKRR